MFVLGVTGGIGSGKSAATDIFSSLGIKIVDADVLSRVPVQKGEAGLFKVLVSISGSALAIIYGSKTCDMGLIYRLFSISLFSWKIEFTVLVFYLLKMALLL